MLSRAPLLQDFRRLGSRRKEATKLRQQHVGKIPVVVEVDAGIRADRHIVRVLADGDSTVRSVVLRVRQLTNPAAAASAWLAHWGFARWKLFPATTLMKEVDAARDVQDGFVYCFISEEKAFG
jgi:hypothetical protein